MFFPRLCRPCDRLLPAEYFSWYKKSTGERQHVCKSCAIKKTLAWEKRNPEKKREAQKSYRARHKVRETQRTLRWRKENPQKYRAIKAAYLRRHPEKNLEWLSNRRTRKLGASGVATAEQIRARVEYYGGRCYMCGGPYEHIDHVIPLSRGGSNWPANLRPACAPCNLKKHDKVPQGVI